MLGALVSFFVGYMFLVVGWYVLTLIARWKIFEKAGLDGWKSLIPFYSDFCTYKIAWTTKYFWVNLAATFIGSFTSSYMQSLTEGGQSVPALISLLSFATALAVLVCNVILYQNLSKKFGHGVGFGLGLMFLTPIFEMILGLGSSRYEGNPEENMPAGGRLYG